MQEDRFTTPGNPTRKVGRHRLPKRRSGRRPYLAGGAVVLVALGLAGAAATLTASQEPAPSTVTSFDTQDRVRAAERADRAEREAVNPAAAVPAPSVSPTRTPSARPSPSPSRKPAATRSPAPRRTTSKPKAAWVDPMPGAQVTSCYGPRGGVPHAGIDLAMPAGTPVRAAAAGTVVNAGWDFAGYGISIVIDHGNGYLTHYAHLSEAKVPVGTKVSAGTVVGAEGSTGDSTGPHLHFEVHQGQLWNQIDPAPFMRDHGVDLGC